MDNKTPPNHFKSVQEAVDHLGELMVLRFINYAWVLWLKPDPSRRRPQKGATR